MRYTKWIYFEKHEFSYKYSYNNFHWNFYTPKIHQSEKLSFFGISRYKFKLRIWSISNLYRVIWVHMTHSYVWHGSFICVTWLIRMCDRTHSYLWYDAFVCVKWPIHMCDTTYSYVWRGSFICVTWLIRLTHMYRSLLQKSPMHSIRMPDMTHSTHLYV